MIRAWSKRYNQRKGKIKETALYLCIWRVIYQGRVLPFFPLENSCKVSITGNQNKAQIRFVFIVTKETHHFELVCPLCSSKKMTFCFWAPWICSNKGSYGCYLANVSSLWDAERTQFHPPAISFSVLEGRKVRHICGAEGDLLLQIFSLKAIILCFAFFCM